MSIGVDIVRGQAIQVKGCCEQLDQLTIMTDSRKLVVNGLFVPLIGDTFNGHQFLSQAIENGAKAALWMEREPIPESKPEKFPLFLVRDTLVALQSMAKAYLNQCRPKVVAVTGSNGKTTTKDMIYSIVSQALKAYKTQGNLNNHIGLPITILSMPADTQVLILEMGMNHFGELTFLSQLAKPDIAVITNIGESHIEFLGSREGIAAAKLEITNGLKKRGTLIIDGDEPLLKKVKTNAFEIITCGFTAGNDWMITDVKEGTDGYHFSLNHGQNVYKVPTLGRHNVKNAVYSLTAARLLNISPQSILTGLQHLSLTKMRFEKVRGVNGALLINDCYNASPTSMKASLETLKMLPGFTKRVAVLGDMYELGANEKQLHRSVAEVLRAPITHVITIGGRGAWIAEPLLEQDTPSLTVKSFQQKGDARAYLASLLDPETVMLFKASRLLTLEELVNDLSEVKPVNG
ncbi:MAG: UDP-N-acetylmuramoyl-tripeptide--D-alanyl-D-alanine ligase [Sporolactobacillus sp.]